MVSTSADDGGDDAEDEEEEEEEEEDEAEEEEESNSISMSWAVTRGLPERCRWARIRGERGRVDDDLGW